jgi:hypothetical protein
MRTPNLLVVIGAVLALLGIMGFAIPVFTTRETKEVARVGDLKLQTTEATPHVIPPVISGGAVVIGIVLIGAGLYQRR